MFLALLFVFTSPADGALALGCTNTFTTQTLGSVTGGLTALTSVSATIDGVHTFNEGSSMDNTSDAWVVDRTTTLMDLDCTDGALPPSSYSKLPVYREACSSVGTLSSTTGLGLLKGVAAGDNWLYAWADGTHEVRADKTTRVKRYAVDDLALTTIERVEDDHLRHRNPCFVRTADSPLYNDVTREDFYDVDAHDFKCEAVTVGTMTISEYNLVAHQRWSYTPYFVGELAYGNARVAGMEIKIDISQSVNLASGQTFFYIQHAKVKNNEAGQEVFQGASIVRASTSALEFHGRMLLSLNGNPQSVEIETCLVIGDTSKANRYASFNDKPCFSWGVDLVLGGANNALVEIMPKKVVWSKKADQEWCDNHSSAPTKAPVTQRRLLREQSEDMVLVRPGRNLLASVESPDVCATLHFEACSETEGAIDAISSARR